MQSTIVLIWDEFQTHMNSPALKNRIVISSLLPFSAHKHWHTQARSVFLWGIGKDRQAPENNWTCSYTTKGSWQRLGRRLGSPREAWSITRPSCARHWNRHTAPPLPSTNTPPAYFSDLISSARPLTVFALLLVQLYLKVGSTGWHTNTHKIMLIQVWKIPKKFPLALCQVAVS